MKTLIDLICQYGREREHLGWLDKYRQDMGEEGNHPAETDAERDTNKQRRKAQRVLEQISKLIGLK